MTTTPFRAFPRFNEPELIVFARSNHRRGPAMEQSFVGDGARERIVQALIARGAITLKEILESFEMHARTRRRMRARHMADLCCGHGLTGLLFATERQVETLTLVDQRFPDSMAQVLDAIVEVCPWVGPKVRVVEGPLDEAGQHLEPGTHCIAVHACGRMTDQVIDIALQVDGDVAVMGCCYHGTASEVPKAIRHALGTQLATDVRRTQRLDEAGYNVDWATIPEAITPMNRVLVACRRRPGP